MKAPRGVFCTHDQTSAPDDDGWVICFGCGNAIRRPHTLEEINRRLEGRP